MLKSTAIALTFALGLAGATANAAELSAIKSRGVLKALTTGNDRPNVYMDASGKPVGFEADMCDLLADKLGVKLELGALAWEGLLPSVTSGRADVICSGVIITDQRKKAFDFSVPYSRTAIVAMVPVANTDIKGPTDIKGKVVGGVIGADGEDVIREIGGFKEIKVYPGVAELFADFLAGRLEVAILGDKQGAGFMAQRPGVLKFVGEPYKIKYVGYPMSRGSTELKAAIDKIITDARKDGTLNTMAKKSFNIDNFDGVLPQPGAEAPVN
jgi:ABC-type amino acid transport substrate-binding protein